MDSTSKPVNEIDGDLTDLQSDLRATAENITADAERIVEIEAEKSGLAANDPRLGALGREAEGLAARMARTTKVQSALVDVARDEASRDEAAQRGPGG